MTPMDGNTAASWVGHSMSDNAFIYPITPSSSMGEIAEQWSYEGKKNVFGQVPFIQMMQSEAGAAGGLHGSAVVGSLCTTFTASQGLLLMIPNMYKIAGELLPTVFHVSARALSRQALSIYGDHSDVMGVRQTGFALLSSSSVQEIMDLGLVAHLASIKSRIPFLHFFEGFRLSHEVSSIHKIGLETMKKMVDYKAIQEHRNRGMNPEHPLIFGHSMGPATYFQTEEAANPFYNAVPKIVQEQMDLLNKYVGRQYHIFDYHGHPEADRIIVIMGAGSPVVEECVNYLNERNEKVGVITVRLFRPFDFETFYKSIPKSCKRIAVLDRTKESGSIGEPLFMDVLSSLKLKNDNRLVVGGRFGLACREFTSWDAKAVFDNLKLEQPMNHFSVGIDDDVNLTSLPQQARIETVPEGTNEAIFFGLGSDGTVTANKFAIKMIVKETDLYGQGYFNYSADKSNAVTESFLRFGPKKVTSEYFIYNAKYVSCNKYAFVHKIDLTQNMEQNGIFVLNSPFTTLEELEEHLPDYLKKTLAQKNARFYVINASKIAEECGIPGKINMIMQTAFFQLSKVIVPEEKAIKLLKKQIKESFTKLSDKIIDANLTAVDTTVENLKQINYPVRKWKQIKADFFVKLDDGPLKRPFTHENFNQEKEVSTQEFVERVFLPINSRKGGSLKVSQLPAGGIMPLSTSKYSKKGISEKIPAWDPEKCIQCNQCSFVCPHSCIRPFVLSPKIERPETFKTIKCQTKAFKNEDYRIQISPYDCVSCGLCIDVCPVDCLSWENFETIKEKEEDNWNFAMTLPERGKETNKFTVAGSQFQKHLLEFPPSCAGCGETQLFKVITQLYGDRMTIANSSGCSSVWGGRFPTSPFTKNEKGYGPAWGRSLFEDTAEYGFGMALATTDRRYKLLNLVKSIIENPNIEIKSELRNALTEWSKDIMDTDRSIKYGEIIKGLIKNLHSSNKLVNDLKNYDDMFIKKSHWCVGGDGWAYDIGYGGLDYVISNNVDVNILVLDTEVYSNTGGQVSRATMPGSVHKFAYGGKIGMKKDLGSMAIAYGSCYVCSIALSNNKTFKHALKAIKEAESYRGPSLIMAYTNCIAHGIKSGMGKGLSHVQNAIDCGYIPLYTFDPRKKLKGKNPFSLDSKEPKYEKIEKFLYSQARYKAIEKTNPEAKKQRLEESIQGIKERYNRYWLLANQHKFLEQKNKKKKSKK
ncbi:pyruvate-flavodoxin oxidoreductase-related [Anaeramoeba flamelloides]|uniref:Pyruvate-flavodoxin oxidoreductase-related n=1 Tax=Anaeramoeba flamelloides TaxID=1746091 RepID=A0AAV7ZYK5_9EUKA|nr:pyruvate-flavodoxin oxidoreductase-related [Anaeramoeba flamelloides]